MISFIISKMHEVLGFKLSAATCGQGLDQHKLKCQVMECGRRECVPYSFWKQWSSAGLKRTISASAIDTQYLLVGDIRGWRSLFMGFLLC